MYIPVVYGRIFRFRMGGLPEENKTGLAGGRTALGTGKPAPSINQPPAGHRRLYPRFLLRHPPVSSILRGTDVSTKGSLEYVHNI